MTTLSSSSSTTTMNDRYNTDYLQPLNHCSSSSSTNNDSNLSPLALLAQTCSSIGQDSSTFSSNSSFIVTKSSSLKRSSPSYTSSTTMTNKKLSNVLKNSSSSSLFDPTKLATTSVRCLNSSCSMSNCFQCQTVRQFLPLSHPYLCPWYSCNGKFTSNDQLIEHLRHHYLSVSSEKNSFRFHPYLKPSMPIDFNDQLPYFYPHLSLSPMRSSSTTATPNNRKN